jgi:hypothetical protein
MNYKAALERVIHILQMLNDLSSEEADIQDGKYRFVLNFNIMGDDTVISNPGLFLEEDNGLEVIDDT